jgi:5-methylcytosine-specific restriction endonuclease McrA
MVTAGAVDSQMRYNTTMAPHERLQLYAANQSGYHRAHNKTTLPTIPQLFDRLEAQAFLCAMCDYPIRKRFYLDHLIPIIYGGDLSLLNIQFLCRGCNGYKGARTDGYVLWRQTTIPLPGDDWG